MTDDALWVSDQSGSKATIPAADRDHWKLHGWTASDEPADGDFVWMEHPDDGIARPGLVAYAARDYWQGIGWQPSAPPEPVNPTRDPALTDAGAVTAGQPPDGTVEDVKQWVGDDPRRAEAALKAEQKRDAPRSTLIGALEQQTSAAPAAPKDEE